MKSQSLICICLLVFSGGCGGGGSPVAMSPFQAHALHITTDIDQAIGPANPQYGVIVEVTQGSNVWAEGFGVANRATGLRMNPGLQFRIASISKTFIGTAILQLADAKKLNLNDPISKTLNGVPNGSNITIQDLGTMTSGLYDWLNSSSYWGTYTGDPTYPWQPQQLLGLTFALGYQPAGKYYFYSNADATLLGLALEKVTGCSFRSLISTRLLVPNGLSNTYVAQGPQFSGPYCDGYEGTKDTTFYDPSHLGLAAPIISTVGDLTRWIRLLGQGALYSPAMQQVRTQFVSHPGMTAVDGNTFGSNGNKLNYYAFDLRVANGWVGHSGQIAGYASECYYNAALDATVVLVVNDDDTVAAGSFLNMIINEFFPSNPFGGTNTDN